jgi:hypothetical protein
MLFRAEAEWSMGRTELAIQDTADLLSRALANANIFEREIYGFAVLVNFRLAAGVIDGGWADGREALLRAQFRTNFDIHLGHSLEIMALISALRADADSQRDCWGSRCNLRTIAYRRTSRRGRCGKLWSTPAWT